jgi:PPOX class probable F420-dependent enzyme
MALDPSNLPAGALAFLAERHHASLTTCRADGSAHVVAVGFTYDPLERIARIITFGGAVKAANAARGGRAVVCQIDGKRWLSLEGPVEVRTDPDRVGRAVTAYAARYRQPSDRSDRVVIEITVDRILGSSFMTPAQ